ncbi:Trafficking protein particle complex subunit 8 [Geodia barretti]|uniref:Trafficking protein particle complex subunit 8 n=1 Tax=Geodia barretti TaxID=519541 RepID=A0AA35RMY4_GEOBA|nr:Trafficking protein particle complex subunit 8 [Geodia barretti]
MAQSLSTMESIIKGSYSLQVAVRSTPDAESLCRKNRLTFCELLEPFSQLGSPVQTKDLQGHPYTLKNVHVRFSDPQLEPTPAAELQRLLSDAVKEGGWEGKQPLIRYGNITTNATTPWYDGYRNIFLGKLRPEDREPIRHYVSVLLVVSSQEADVMEAFAELYSTQKESEQTRSSNWLTPHMFYYHILLHDTVNRQTAGVEDKLSKLQATYGAGSCCLLKINSRWPGSVVLGDNPWSRVARHYTSHNSNGEDETDGLSSKLRFSITGKQRRHKKSLKISPKNPTPPNHSPAPVTSSPSSSLSSSTSTAHATPPLLPTTSISPPPSISSNSSLPVLPTDTHPLLEDAPANNETIAPATITPNVREEAKLVQSSSEDSITEMNENKDKRGEGEEREGEERGGERREGGRTAPDDVGQFLSAEDETRMRNFVTEFVAQRLVPHLEAVLKNLNEWLISRRSVRRSISTMSKRFFGMLGGQLNNAAIDEPSYTSSSQEFQTRQFADLLFLLQSYDLAFANYCTVRKDFQSSSAWMHYAKTVEMCAVTAYMLSSTRRDIVPFFEEAISMFATSCKSPVSALRCSMLQCEVLKERGLYRPLTQICIKMTSEESDLHSAVCLEQAAHSFLRVHPPMARKYALHLILAGHRFAKSSQRVTRARVYTQALELYRGKGWALAELLLSDTDYCAGQQVNLGPESTSLTSADRVQSVPLLPIPFVKNSLTRVIFQTGISSERLRKLTENSVVEEEEKDEEEEEEEEGRGREVARPIGGARMRQILQQLTESNTITSCRNLKPIMIGARDFNPQTVKGSTEEWRGLEEVAARGPQGTPHENFKPSVVIMDESTDNSRVPHCVVNESVSVGVVLRNPLKVPLVLRNVALTWSHTPLSAVSGGGEGRWGEERG